MIRLLFRQDTALRSMPSKLITSMLLGFVLRRDLELLPVDIGSGSPSSLSGGVSFLFLLVWCICVFYIVSAGSWSRCSRLNMTLPISTRKLWLVRIISIVYSGLIPLAVMAVALSVRFTGWGTRLTLHMGVMSLAAHMGGGLVLTAVLFQLPYSGLYRMRGLDYIILNVLTGIGVLVLISLVPPSPLFLIIIISVAVLLAVKIYFSLPESFSLASVTPSIDKGYGESSGVTSPAGRKLAGKSKLAAYSSGREGKPGYPELKEKAGRAALGTGNEKCWAAEIHAEGEGNFQRFLYFTAWRTLQNNVGSWFLLLGLLFFGILMCSEYHNGEDTEAIIVFLLLMLWGQIILAAQRIHKLDYLPVARKVFFAVAILPGIAAVLLGVGLAELDNATSPRKKAQIHYRKSGIEVPHECWEITWDARPPAAASSWGESYMPRADHLYGDGGMAVYNPCEFGPESSPGFIALQIARAVNAVHGNTESPEEAANRMADDDGFKAAIAGGTFAVSASIGRGSDVRSRVYAMSVLICGIFGVLFLSVALKQYGSTVYGSVFRGIAIVLFIAVTSSYLISSALEQAGIASVWVLHASILISIRMLCGQIPLSTTMLWVLSGAVLLGGYLVVLRSFNRIEAPGRRLNKELWHEF